MAGKSNITTDSLSSIDEEGRKLAMRPDGLPQGSTDESSSSSSTSSEHFEALLEVSFRLPSTETIKLDISGLESLYIRDLKKRLNGCGVGLPSSKMKFVYGSRVIQDRELIGDVCFKPGDVVFVVISLVASEEVSPKYDDFILSSLPKHLAVNVPTDTEIHVTLRANMFGQGIFTDALIAVDSNVRSLNSGNMVRNLDNDRTLAENKGYKRWIEDHQLRGKIYLLQVDEDLDMKLDNIRYNVDGINTGYCKGDEDSWQRYTNRLPVPCNVIVSSFFDPTPHVIRIYPHEPLQPNTQYAILLQNNVPVRPLEMPHYTIDFFSESTGDDKIIMFKTEKIKGKSISAGRRSPDRTERRKHILF